MKLLLKNVAILYAASLTSVLFAQSDSSLSIPEAWANSHNWRSIGPAGMGGRITSIAVNPLDHSQYWVGTATAGVLRTDNNGVTFKHLFEREAVASVGDIAVAPSNPKVVWVGTGENNPRNSVSYGNGVYKSVDAGETWTHMGLKDSFQIGHVVVHPKNENVVYVGALGSLWGKNDERGLFKTTDGGKTWEKVLYIDNQTGIIDVILDPRNPDTVYAASWTRMRGEFDSYPGPNPPLADGVDGYDPIVKWGKGSGIWKSTNGGKSWKKLDKGLPTSPMGRIGLDIWAKDPKVLVAIVDCEDIGKGAEPPNTSLGFTAVTDGQGVKVAEISGQLSRQLDLQAGDRLSEMGGKALKSMEAVVQAMRAGKAGDSLTFTRVRGNDRKEVKVALRPTPRPGTTPTVRGTLGLNLEDGAKGLRVDSVRDGRLAAEAGIKAGDLIVAVDGKLLTEERQLAEVIAAKRETPKVEFRLERESEKLTVSLNLPEDDSKSRRWYTGMLGGQNANIQDLQGADGHRYGGVYRSNDGGETWKRLNSVNPRPMYFSKIRIDPQDDRFLYVTGISMFQSVDGGYTFTGDASARVHSDQHALWVSPKDSRHLIVGTDGGWYTTYDRTATWEHHNNHVLAQFYHVAVDSSVPYRVAGGLQDNGSWVGPSLVRSGSGPINEDWYGINGGDGFVCRFDREFPEIVYAESQGGVMARRNLKTGEFARIAPRPETGWTWRFNWNTPMILSEANAAVFYAGGNVVFRSMNRGSDLRRISPEISRTNQGTATALSESPINPNVLWAGTDDGYLWVTKDNGQNWENVTQKVGLPGYRWVGTIEASRFAEGRAYVCFTAHRSDDNKPYLFVTEDFGQTWKPIHGGLPEFGTTRCLREDTTNPNLLYVGTEFSVFASIDRGATWQRINGNLPTCRVDEIAVHGPAGEIVAGTHARGIWIVNVMALRQMTAANMEKDVVLYAPADGYIWRRDPSRGYGSGHEKYFGTNPPMGTHISYSLKKQVSSISLEVVDAVGRVVRRFTGLEREPGLHHVPWDIPSSVAPGTYKLVLKAGETTAERPLVVRLDPALTNVGAPLVGGAGPEEDEDKD